LRGAALQFLSCPARSLVTTSTELSCLPLLNIYHYHVTSHSIGFVVLTVVDITPCSPVKPRGVRRNISLPPSGLKSKPSKKPEKSELSRLTTQLSACFRWLLAWLITWLWWWRRYVPSKRSAFSELHGVTMQKTKILNHYYVLYLMFRTAESFWENVGGFEPMLCRPYTAWALELAEA
jgi:hypothetical protein